VNLFRQSNPVLGRTGQVTWATFLRNHASEIWACDFLQTYDVFFRTVFVFVIIELGSRRVVHFGVTRNPTDQWTAQQLREATSFGEKPRLLIRDNDGKFGPSFARVAAEIEVLKTPYRAPKANAICERFLGSLRRECLDHFPGSNVFCGLSISVGNATLFQGHFCSVNPENARFLPKSGAF